jgi:hypothetical protein
VGREVKKLSPRLRTILRGATTRATTKFSNNGERPNGDTAKPVTLPKVKRRG